MSATGVTHKTASDDTTIRPFEVDVPDAELTELRRRIDTTRWPERETVMDDSQGVPLALMRELARYWGSAPRSWAERAYPHNLIHYNQLDEGGHFAAWEQPQLFSQEMRDSFRSLR